MRRSVLLTLAILGGVVSLIGGVGLFSALTDTARTGTNSAESDALAASADIQLATATNNAGVIACGQFSDDLATGFFTLSNLQPGSASGVVYYCIKNAGSQPVTLSVGVDELTDLELACTGDEALFDDTCAAEEQGELSDVVFAGLTSLATCDAVFDIANTGQSLSGLAQEPIGIGYFDHEVGSPLPPGETGCFYVEVGWNTFQGSDKNQRAQSDSVTWRFRFDAQT